MLESLLNQRRTMEETSYERRNSERGLLSPGKRGAAQSWHHSASFAEWCSKHTPFAPSQHLLQDHLPLQVGGLTLSEAEMCMTSGFPGLGGEERPFVWSQGHMGKEAPVNNDISRTFQSHQKLASWEPHSGLAVLFYFYVFLIRLKHPRSKHSQLPCEDNGKQL